MANLFDVANAPKKEPTSFVAGVFLQWTRDDLVEDYPLASYSLVYTARLRGGANPEIRFTAVEEQGTYVARLNSTTTAGFIPGDYYWQAEIVRSSDNASVIVDSGEWTIVANLDRSGADPRSHAQIMVDKIEALLEGRADKDVSSYSIQGRSLSKMAVSELLDWRDYYRREVTREKQKAAIAAGKQGSATVKVRFQ